MVSKLSLIMTETPTSSIKPITSSTADTLCCQMLWILLVYAGINGGVVGVTTIMLHSH